MNNDAIDRQAAIDAIYETFCYAYCDNCEKEMNEDFCGDCHRKYQNWAASKKIISKTINSLPSAERHGRWEIADDMPRLDNTFSIRCSLCGQLMLAHPNDENPNFCCNCGAKMVEVEE